MLCVAYFNLSGIGIGGRDCGLSVGAKNNSSTLPNARPNVVVFGGFSFELQDRIVESSSAEIPEEIESFAVTKRFLSWAYRRLSLSGQKSTLSREDDVNR